MLRPGGTLAVSVPRWFPEIINWKLSDDYHNVEGGHIRIYTDAELIDKVTKAGAAYVTTARATRTACTRRTGGSSARSGSTTTTTRSRRRTTSSWSGRS